MSAHFISQDQAYEPPQHASSKQHCCLHLSGLPNGVRIMSFLLLPHEDESATLEAALAFLDSCGVGGNDDEGPSSSLTDISTDADTTTGSSDEPDCALSSDSSSSSSRSTRYIVQHAHKRSNAQRNKAHRDTSSWKREQPVPTVARRVRKRGAVELTELRDLVRQLTARLDQLQARRMISLSHVNAVSQDSLSPINTADECIRARDGAIVALEELRKSTAVNRQLRAAWKKQIKLAKKLENLITKQLSPLDIELLVKAKSGKRAPSAGKEDSTIQVDISCFVQLRWYLESMYQQTAPISASISIKRDTSRVFSSSYVHHNSVLGDVFECTTNTPVACSVQDLDVHVRDLLLNEKAMKKKPSVVKYVTHELPNQPTSLEHQFTQNFDCQFGGILVHGVSVSHKYEDLHRRVLAYTSLLTLEGTDLTFRETGWLIIRDHGDTDDDISDVKGSGHSLLQGCYRIHREETSSNAADSANSHEDGAYFQNFILHSQCEEMRTKQLHLQDAVLQRFGSACA